MKLYPLRASLYTFGTTRINTDKFPPVSVIIRDGFEPESLENLDFLFIESGEKAGLYVIVSDFYFKRPVFRFANVDREKAESLIDTLAEREDNEDFFNRDKALLVSLGGIEIDAI